LRTVQKFLVTRYLRGVSWLWGIIPESLRSLSVFVRYGVHLHSLTLRFVDRRQNHSTFFFRNRAELELIRRLADRARPGSSIDIAVFACSKGAEVYSIAWVLKGARPDLRINLKGIDISQDILEFASRGEYSLQVRDNHGGALELGAKTHRDQPPGYSPFMFMSEGEKSAMFDRDGDVVRVKSWIKNGITWQCLDAGDPELMSVLSPQDVIVANRFLCHMGPAAAERILRNLSRVVKPGGYLFTSGVDLDVRMRVAVDMKWKPVTELIEEVHDGDPSIRDGWPFDYWAKEPLDADRSDAMIRYAPAFQAA
jgi:chemotaxis protein methyltransferase CheR